MTCSDFLARFSEFYDGDPSSDDQEAFKAHLASCGSCRRYLEVVERGVELLKALPRQRPREDFQQRLQHAIYNEDEARWRRRGPQSVPGTGAMTLVAAVAILAAILWTPFLFENPPSVDLPPVVVSSPERPSSSPNLSSPVRSSGSSFLDPDLWAQPNSLLFEYSPLQQRSRESGMVRTGLQ